MNVSFKTIRRSGDKAYILSEISDYDERLPVVLAASTESGARIPSDTFPYCDIDDALSLQQILFDGALANHETSLPSLHTKNSAGVRFFVITLPWLDIRRWVLDFHAIDSSGHTITSCRKVLDMRATNLMSLAGHYTNRAEGALVKELDGRFIHDRIHVKFLRAQECDVEIRVSALLEMPYHTESSVEIDFLDRQGKPLGIEPYVVEDTVTHAVDYGSLERRFIEISFTVPKSRSYICVCATDTVGSVAPGFAVLGPQTLPRLLEEFKERTTCAYDDEGYHDWFTNVHRADLPILLEQTSLRFDYAPLFSIVCVLADTPEHHVFDLVNSLAQQSYGRWELILVNVSGTNQYLSDVRDLFGGERLYIIDADPSLGLEASLNAGMAAIEGDFIVVMRVCNKLAPDALFECTRMINEFPECDVLYSDVDTFDAEGVHSHPLFRPDFSPELLRSYNYLRDFLVVRTSLLHELEFFTQGIALPNYDLVLRVTEKARRVCHVPRILCHRRLATLEIERDPLYLRLEQEAGRKVLVEHCKRMGFHAEVLNADVQGHYRVRHVLVETPHVVIVIPSENNAELLQPCIRSLYNKLTYRNFEVVVVEVGESDSATQECLEQLTDRYDTLSVIPWKEEFNRARMANHVAEQTTGEYFLFLNDDTRVLTDDALEVLLGYFQSSDVGVVGPKQLFVDGTIEHAGIVVGGSRGVTPLFRHMSADCRGYLDRAMVAQNVSAVTGDCMMVRRSVLDEVGGFTDAFSIFYADVDFCLKAREAGYYTVFTPYVCLSRFHSVSRVRNYSKSLRIKFRQEAALLESSWPRYFVEGDTFYNCNLDPDSSYFALKHKRV